MLEDLAYHSYVWCCIAVSVLCIIDYRPISTCHTTGAVFFCMIFFFWKQRQFWPLLIVSNSFHLYLEELVEVQGFCWMGFGGGWVSFVMGNSSAVNIYKAKINLKSHSVNFRAISSSICNSESFPYLVHYTCILPHS